MKVKKFFRTSRGLIGTTHLYPLPSAVHIATAHKWIHTALHTMCPLPSIYPRSAPEGSVYEMMITLIAHQFILHCYRAAIYFQQH